MSNFEALSSVFVCILLGYMAARTAYVTETVERGLTEFVFKVAVPALIFLAMAKTTQAQPLWNYWLAYFGGGALVWALCAGLAKWRLHQPTRSALILGFSTSQSNTVFVGVPLILQAFGPDASYPLFMLLAVHMPVMMTVATLVIEADSPQPLLHKLGDVARKMFMNPIFLALLAGIAWRALHLDQPAVAAHVLSIFAQCTSACALFALGASVHRLGLHGQLAPASLVVVGKLVLHPLAVWVLAYHVLNMPPIFAAVATMFAAMPVGINAFMMASKYQAGEATVASSIAVSTLLAAGSAMVWLSLVKV